MKKNIWKRLQIVWLLLAMFTAHNSILALNDEDAYCSGAYCETNNDCASPCFCDALYSTCMKQIETGR